MMLSDDIRKKNFFLTPYKMGRLPDKGKQLFLEQCRLRGLKTTGSTLTLFKRIQQYDLQQVGKGVTKTHLENVEKVTQSPNSSPKKPLTMSAQAYVKLYCNDDAKQARAEWVKTSSAETATSKWMKIGLHNSKAGYILRWVKAS